MKEEIKIENKIEIKEDQKESEEEKNVVRVNNSTTNCYLEVALKLLNMEENDSICLIGSDKNLTKTVTLAEILKRRRNDLHQINKIFSVKNNNFIKIILSKTELDKLSPGYQAPSPQSHLIENENTVDYSIRYKQKKENKKKRKLEEKK